MQYLIPVFFKGLFDNLCIARQKPEVILSFAGFLSRHSNIDNFSAIIVDDLQDISKGTRFISHNQIDA